MAIDKGESFFFSKKFVSHPPTPTFPYGPPSRYFTDHTNSYNTKYYDRI